MLGELSLEVQAYNPSTRQGEAGLSAQDHLWLHIEFKTSLGCMRLYLKTKSKQNRKHVQVPRDRCGALGL